MYYILNETNQIIAADDSVLSLCGVTHIDELASSIIKGDTIFKIISNEDVLIKAEGINEAFTLSKTSLSSMLGQLTLITLSNQDEKVDTIISDDDTDDVNIIDSTAENEEENKSIEENFLGELEIKENDDVTSLSLADTDDENITFSDHLSLNDDIMSLKSEIASDKIKEETEIEKVDESELFNLVLDDIVEDKYDESITETETEEVDNSELLNLVLDDIVEEDKNDESETIVDSEVTENKSLKPDLNNDNFFLEEKEVADVSEIYIDIEEISQKIGISTDDYNTFLNDFIDTALELEQDLQNNDNEIRSNAIGTLNYLSEVLHLPIIGNILTKIAQTESENPRKEVELFYSTLSRITTSVSEVEEITEKEETISEDTPEVIEEEKLELFDEPKIITEPILQEEIKPQKPTNEKSFGTISLEGIKPKHFDFQLEEAANDLSLPVELIEEFVHDFIDQAHIETKKILEAYEEGDLDTIQKIGHLLKGASSNLRITPLSDTLYKIQFCENTNDLEALIKDYWAHFLSFETQIDIISN